MVGARHDLQRFTARRLLLPDSATNTEPGTFWEKHAASTYKIKERRKERKKERNKQTNKHTHTHTHTHAQRDNIYFFYYVHGSEHRKSISINVQRDVTIWSLYFILLQYHSTCFGCRPHPSSGVHKTVVTATGTSNMIVQLPHSNVAKLATLEWGSCTIIRPVPVAVTSFIYSWWWVWTAPRTCRVIFQ